MKAKRPLPFMILFASSLFMGFLIGWNTSMNPVFLRLPHLTGWLKRSNLKTSSLPASQSAAAAPSTPLPVPSLETGQRNLLVIGVDNLDESSLAALQAAPRLESVWLVLYSIDRPQVILLPIYPSPAQGSSSSDDKERVNLPSLSAAFSLSADRTPSPSFLQSLESKDIWWNHYVLLDRLTLSRLAEFTGASETLGGQSTLVKPAQASEEPKGGLEGQARFARDLCRRSASLASTFDLAPLLSLFPNHLITDLDLNQAVQLAHSLLSGAGGFSCEFPTLAASAPFSN